MTKNRKLILEIIKSSDKHLTADEIYMKAKKIQPFIAVGTVYRNLTLMEKDGEIRRIAIANVSDRFDKSTHLHEHLVCQKCRALSDIFLPDLQDYLEKQTGIKISGYDLNLKYICDECQKEGSNEKI